MCAVNIIGAVDYGDAPEIYLSGIARVRCVSAGIVRVSCYADRERHDGKPERRIAMHALWDLAVIAGELALLSRAIDAMHAESHAYFSRLRN
jgi:hypothetical protein